MTRFEEFVNTTQMSYESFYQLQVNLNKRRAIILGVSTIVSLIFVLYGYLQKVEADNLRLELNELQTKNNSLQAEYENCSKTSK